MAKGIWGALKRLGRNKQDETAPAKPAPGVTARKTVTASGRPHLVVRKVTTGAPAATATVTDDAKGSEKVKAIRMRTKAPRSAKTEAAKGEAKKGRRGLVRRRADKVNGAAAVVARKEEALMQMRSSFKELGGTLQEIHQALREEQARGQAVAEKLHHVPEILSALPAIAERQQACLDRMADRTEALAVIPKALAAVHDHAKAQIATLAAIRENLERRAEREERMVMSLTEVSHAMNDVSDQAQAQIDEIRTLGDGQRTLVDGVKEFAGSTTDELKRQNAELWTKVNERDRQRRNRLLAVAAGLGLGVAALGAVAAHAGASTLRSMQRSSMMLAETATRDMQRVERRLRVVGDLERRIAEREEELRLLLTAAERELATSRKSYAAELARREAELKRLRGELAGQKGAAKSATDLKAPSTPQK